MSANEPTTLPDPVLQLILRVIQGLVATTAAVVVLLIDVNPDFKLEGVWVYAIVIAVVLAGVIPPIAEGIIGYFGGERARLRAKSEQVLRAAFVNVVDTAQIDWHTLRLNVWLLRRTLRHPRGVQERLLQLRMTSSPPPSHIAWTRGKGVVGRCWALGKPIAMNLRKDYKPLEGCTEDAWKSAPAETRMGLSHREFMRVQRYGIVVACPMRRPGGKYRGCVSLDAPGDNAKELLGEHREEVLEILQFAADVIMNIESP